MANKETEVRQNYKSFHPITTRWRDNDLYGHVNNVVYYSYFDSAANAYLIEEGGLDIHNGSTIAYVVNSHCNYHSAIAYPEKIEAGLRVDKLGTSSVTYGIAIFREKENQAAANGQFIHVFVDRESGKPVPIPDKIRTALEAILVTRMAKFV
ncbi:MAG: acyl-CoA thioesterase [Oleiphilaceae bacterium]|nr:acyl-CoA thioesterase [Oleiphilaceae bacterium]